MASKSKQRAAGDGAEARARSYFSSRGCSVVAANVHLERAELDLVVREGELVVFVEVRKRKTRDDALESVSKQKQQKLIRAASAWLALHAPDAKARFDVVAIVGDAVHHVEDAFSAG